MQIDPNTLLIGAVALGKLIEVGFRIYQEGTKTLLLIDSLSKEAEKDNPVSLGLLIPSTDYEWVIDNEKNHHDIAVLIQVTNWAADDVKRYLDDPANGLDANLYVISHDNGNFNGSALDNEKPEEWEAVLQKCMQHIGKLRQRYGPDRFHLFYSGPAALAMALGCKLRQYPAVKLYTYYSGKYYPVLDLKP